MLEIIAIVCVGMLAVLALIILFSLTIDLLPKRDNKKSKKKDLPKELERLKKHIYLNFEDYKFYVMIKKHDTDFINNTNYTLLEVIEKEQFQNEQWVKVSYKDLPFDTPYVEVIGIDDDLRATTEYFILLNGIIEVENGKVSFKYPNK